jgi:hypothetical protein
MSLNSTSLPFLILNQIADVQSTSRTDVEQALTTASIVRQERDKAIRERDKVSKESSKIALEAQKWKEELVVLQTSVSQLGQYLSKVVVDAPSGSTRRTDGEYIRSS